MKVPVTTATPRHPLKSRKLKLKHGKPLREQRPSLGRAGPDSNHLFTVNRYGRFATVRRTASSGLRGWGNGRSPAAPDLTILICSP